MTAPLFPPRLLPRPPRRRLSERVLAALVVAVLAVLAVVLPIAFGVGVVVAGGVVLHYLWDVLVIHTFTAAPHVSIVQAIGLSTLVAYLVNKPMTDTERRERIVPGLKMLAGALLVTFVLHFFIPGA